MQVILINIGLGLLLYSLTLVVFFLNENRRNKTENKSNNEDLGGDDDGGVPVSFPPDFDLPPGIFLPDTPIDERKLEREEILA